MPVPPLCLFCNRIPLWILSLYLPSSREPFFIDQLTRAHHRASLLSIELKCSGERRAPCYFSLFCGIAPLCLLCNRIVDSESQSLLPLGLGCKFSPMPLSGGSSSLTLDAHYRVFLRSGGGLFRTHHMLRVCLV